MLDEFLAPIKNVKYVSDKKYEDYKNLAQDLIRTNKQVIQIAKENYSFATNTFVKARKLYDMLGVENRHDLQARYILYLEEKLGGIDDA
jgi:hypothetical protein